MRGGVACSVKFSASSRCSPAAAPTRGRPSSVTSIDELKALRALAERRDSDAADAVQSLKRELALIRDTIARNKRELGALIGDGKERRMARAADELRASVDGMEHATQKILKSVEVIDDSAKALAAVAEGRLRARPGAGHPGPRGADLRGLQFPGPRRPAHRQCDRHHDDGRGAGRGHARSLQRSSAASRACRGGQVRAAAAGCSTARSSTAIAAMPASTTSTRCSADLTSAGRLITTKQTSATAAKPAASASAVASDARSTTKAITSGAAACITRNGPASRPISRP